MNRETVLSLATLDGLHAEEMVATLNPLAYEGGAGARCRQALRSAVKRFVVPSGASGAPRPPFTVPHGLRCGAARPVVPCGRHETGGAAQ